MDYAAKLMIYAGAGVVMITLFAGPCIFLLHLAHVTYKEWDGMGWDERAGLIMLTAISAGIYLLIVGLLIFAASQTVFANT